MAAALDEPSHLLFLDFEATCEGGRDGRGDRNYAHEIIEWPAVAVDALTAVPPMVMTCDWTLRT